ncbi:twin-arginine translocation signal domain-containing protein [Kribbella sp. NPDC023972]|uniref:twin-arginine translocation signal domain-containing protein n=1 Tax=Kribbella sp. NPDC023972 TaxID=3154795 RepID=UPI0033D2D58B
MNLNRRDFLKVSGGVVAASALSITPAFAAADIDYTARKTFDDWDRLFQQGGPGQPDQPNDNTNADGRSGMLAWSQSYVLLGLIRMYETYRDTYYLDRLIDNVDQVLSVRDSERGVTDYRGLSLPAWRADHPYTTGYTTLADSNGRLVLELRQALPYAEDTTVTVTAGSRPDAFTVRLVNTQVNRTVTLTDLSMDPASPDYAVSRIYAAAPGPLQLTARDVSEAALMPVTGEFPMVTRAVIFAVHTGMITYPIASFVRLVRGSAVLRRRYRAKAAEYLTACHEAVAVHDWEYRETSAGGGYFIWPKEQPLAYDGCEQPINQSLGLGQTLVELGLATGDREYRRKVAALAKMFAGQLAVDSGDAYQWRYWPMGGRIFEGFTKTGSPATDVSIFTPAGGPARQFEDISHGAIDVEFAVRAFRARLGFTGADMARLARTYTQNVATTDANGLPAIRTTVAGTTLGAASVAHQAPRWMQATPWDPAIHHHCLALYNRYQPTPEKDGQQAIGFGWLLANVAYLNWGAKYGG